MSAASKKEIRGDLIEQRDSLSNDIWIANSNRIQRTLIRSKLFNDCDALLVYADFHGEVGTLMLVDEALILGKAVFLPKVLENFTEARMEFYRIYSSTELVNGYKGIREPTGSIERAFNYGDYKGKNVLMLVPGVAFDKRGYRLGYGKGYYDNYLKDKEKILTVGICFDMQICDDLPVTENDIKLDYLISEKTDAAEIDNWSFKTWN